MTDDMKFAGFWKRLLAFVIDYGMFIIVFSAWVFFQTGSLQFVGYQYIPLAVAASIYFIVMPVTPLQATVGKAVLGMKMTDQSFRKMTLPRALARYLSQGISYLILFLGFVLIGLTKENTGLHDIIAKTYVVYKH